MSLPITATALETQLCLYRCFRRWLPRSPIKTVLRTIRFMDLAPFHRLGTMALVGMSTAGKGLADLERNPVVEKIVTESAPVLAQYSD